MVPTRNVYYVFQEYFMNEGVRRSHCLQGEPLTNWDEIIQAISKLYSVPKSSWAREESSIPKEQ